MLPLPIQEPISHQLKVYQRSALFMAAAGNRAKQQQYEWAALLEAEGLRRQLIPIDAVLVQCRAG